ncbi:hypothetical protein BI311_24970 [Xanthomonas citri pv. citri]|nr:hypothetical protein BI311_24970 [Xanthomonas citri pv. citri]
MTVTVWPLAVLRLTVKVPWCAAVALDHADIVDRQRRRRVVVDDRAKALCIGHIGAGDIADVDEVGFVRFVRVSR